jgi:ubiquinone/menaquinone biosynthesis C-methylase UbiE
VLWGDIESTGGTHLRDISMDRVIVSNTLFQVEEKERFVREVFRIVRPGGKALVVDWSDSSDISGPNRAHLIGKGDARELFERGGFSFEKEIPAGAHHYGIIMVRK